MLEKQNISHTMQGNILINLCDSFKQNNEVKMMKKKPWERRKIKKISCKCFKNKNFSFFVSRYNQRKALFLCFIKWKETFSLQKKKKSIFEKIVFENIEERSKWNEIVYRNRLKINDIMQISN